MKASLEIENIGDDTEWELRGLINLTNSLAPGLGTATFGSSGSFDGSKKRKIWVAKITDFDDVFNYKREFIRWKKDYTRANRKGSRGVYKCFILESGFVYEVNGKNARRYFCIVDDDGNIVEVKKEYVDEWITKWIKDHLELPF